MDPTQLVFTSGATEANNLALLGYARVMAEQTGHRGHLISVSSEHHAVLDPPSSRARGVPIDPAEPGSDGLVKPAQLEEALQPDTLLVSVMAANNEIGVLQPLKELAAICRPWSLFAQ